MRGSLGLCKVEPSCIEILMSWNSLFGELRSLLQAGWPENILLEMGDCNVLYQLWKMDEERYRGEIKPYLQNAISSPIDIIVRRPEDNLPLRLFSGNILHVFYVGYYGWGEPVWIPPNVQYASLGMISTIVRNNSSILEELRIDTYQGSRDDWERFIKELPSTLHTLTFSRNSHFWNSGERNLDTFLPLFENFEIQTLKIHSKCYELEEYLPPHLKTLFVSNPSEDLLDLLGRKRPELLEGARESLTYDGMEYSI